MKRKIICFIFVLIASFALIGCGQTGDYNGGSGNDNSIVVETSRKIYYVVDLNIQTEDINKSIEEFTNVALSYNGYLSNSDINQDSICYITYRVPTDKLNDFINNIKNNALSEVESEKIKTTDITTQYNEVDARLEVLNSSRISYINLLEKAESITDIITIQTRIEEIDSEILKLEKEKSAYDNLIDYSTINIQLYEGNISFASSYLNYVVNLFKIIGIIILYLFPIALIALVIFIIIKFINKKNKNKTN